MRMAGVCLPGLARLAGRQCQRDAAHCSRGLWPPPPLLSVLIRLPWSLVFLAHMQEGGASATPPTPAVASGSRRYLVSQQLGTGAVALMAQQLSKQFAVPLIPWAAVAADVTSAAANPSPNPSKQDAQAAEEDDEAPAPQLQGTAYCFLPLPAATGLPVHVNAFFELSSNRRDIWCAPLPLPSFTCLPKP